MGTRTDVGGLRVSGLSPSLGAFQCVVRPVPCYAGVITRRALGSTLALGCHEEGHILIGAVQ